MLNIISLNGLEIVMNACEIVAQAYDLILDFVVHSL